MKISPVFKQIFTFLAALLCVILFRAVASLHWQLTLILVFSVVGGLLGWFIGFHALMFPIYSFSSMFTLGLMHIEPYYSSDLPLYLPTLLYSMFVCPSAVISTNLIAGINWFLKRKNKPNQNMEVIR